MTLITDLTTKGKKCFLGLLAVLARTGQKVKLLCRRMSLWEQTSLVIQNGKGKKVYSPKWLIAETYKAWQWAINLTNTLILHSSRHDDVSRNCTKSTKRAEGGGGERECTTEADWKFTTCPSSCHSLNHGFTVFMRVITPLVSTDNARHGAWRDRPSMRNAGLRSVSTSAYIQSRSAENSSHNGYSQWSGNSWPW